MRINQESFSYIVAMIMSGFIAYAGFSTYISEQPNLVEVKGQFSKLEVVAGYKNNKDYHILLEDSPNRYEIAYNGFKKDSFELDVIFKDPLVLLVDEEDLKQPRNGWFDSDQRKNQVSTYEIRGPKKTYLLKEDSFASRDTNNKVLAPIMGGLGLIGFLFAVRRFRKLNSSGLY